MLSKLNQWLDARRRDRALRAHPIPDALWRETLERLPFLSYLSGEIGRAHV